jgi:DNA replication protein DnaC
MYTGQHDSSLARTGLDGAKSKQKKFVKQVRMAVSQVMKSPAQVCPLCEGSGWKTVTASKKTADNGVLSIDEGSTARGSNARSINDRRVTRCDCQLRARAQSLLAAARIPQRYEHCELSNFDFDGSYRSLAPARMAACKFVEEYPMNKTGLLLIGTIGVGKTHLAVGMIKELILGKGIGCLFFDYRELLKQIQNSYNDSVKTTELDVLRPVFEAEVLVLDELGAVRPTEWVWDTVSLILNTRYNDKRTTIVTTNYRNLAERERPANVSSRSPQAAKYAAENETLGDRIGNRMHSRLHEMCRIVTMEGADFRQTVKSASFPPAFQP